MSVQGFDHYIQRQIFKKLREYEVARYADLNIKSIESSQFMYHLKDLIKQGLVEKVDKGRYKLTQKGITVSQNFSADNENMTLAPLTYTLIFARSKSGKWLLVKRGKQPYINMYGCISGKVHMQETLQAAAEKEWREGTDLDLPKFKYVGQASVLLNLDNDVITHIAGPIWFADNLEEDWQIKNSRLGELVWADWEALPYKQFIPGWKEIVEAIETEKHPFLLDLTFTL